MGTVKRVIGKFAVVLAVAALLLGGLAVPARASPRSQGVSDANDYIFGCVQMGGDPVVVMDSTGENLTVLCRYSDGRVAVCQFLPVKKDCQWVTPLKSRGSTPISGPAISTK
jgi:hypothetical protein